MLCVDSQKSSNTVKDGHQNTKGLAGELQTRISMRWLLRPIGRLTVQTVIGDCLSRAPHCYEGSKSRAHDMSH